METKDKNVCNKLQCEFCQGQYHPHSVVRHMRLQHGNHPSLEQAINRVLATKSRKAKKFKLQKKNANGTVVSVNCKICGVEIQSLSSLKVHVRKCKAKWATSQTFKARAHALKLIKTKRQSQTPFISVQHSDEKKFKCELCSKSYHFSTSLSRHRCKNKIQKGLTHTFLPPQISVQHLDEKKFKCEFCSKFFCHSISLFRHKRTHKTQKGIKQFLTAQNPPQRLSKKKFKCQFCSKSFCHKSSLFRHKRTHKTRKGIKQFLTAQIPTQPLSKKKFKCEFCSKSFCQNSLLFRHKRIHKTQKGIRQLLTSQIPARHLNEKKFKCEICTKLYYHSFSVIRHRVKHKLQKGITQFLTNKSSEVKHSTQLSAIKQQSRYTCKYCHLSFMYVGSFTSHVCAHGVKKLKQSSKRVEIRSSASAVKCKLCGGTFQSRVSLKVHYRSCNCKPKMTRTKNAKSCDAKNFKESSASPSFHTTYECLECLQSFNNYHIYYRHRLLHVGFLECKKCDLQFFRVDHLNFHMEAHRRKVRLPVKCSRCIDSFKSKQGLRSHVRLHDNHNFYNVSCDKCFLVFTDNCIGTHIQARHTRKLAFQCNTCCSEFDSVSDVAMHHKLHINQQYYKTKYKQTLNRVWESLQQSVTVLKSGSHKSLGNTSTEQISLKSYKSASLQQVTVDAHKFPIQPKTSSSASSSPMVNFKCSICEMVFKSRISLALHKRKHKMLTKSSTLANSALLNELPAVRISATGKTPDHKCKICGLVLPTGPKLGGHMFAHRMAALQKSSLNAASSAKLESVKIEKSGSIPVLECKLCDIKFKYAACWRTHIQRHKLPIKKEKKQTAKKNCEKEHLELPSSELTAPDADSDSPELLSCCECLRLSKSKESLYEHQLRHLGILPHKCPDCGIQFERPHHLKLHAVVHKNKLPFRCSRCTASFKNEIQLIRHERYHDNPNVGHYRCDRCKFLFFRTTSALERHISARHTKMKRFKCDLCQAQFNNQYHLSEHTKLHKRMEKLLELSQDQQSYAEITVLNSNSLTKPSVTSERAKDNKCEICYKKFLHINLLLRHMIREHKMFFCDICKRFVKKSCLSKTSYSAVKHKCLECDALLAKETNVTSGVLKPKIELTVPNENTNSDTDDSMTCCEICYQDISSTSLQQHMVFDHQRFFCSICKCFVEKHCLSKSSRSCKKYECIKCNASLPQKTKLASTVSNVETDRSALSVKATCKGGSSLTTCEICYNEYMHTNSLLRHMIINHQRFYCDICKRFVEKHCLSKTPRTSLKFECLTCHASSQRETNIASTSYVLQSTNSHFLQLVDTLIKRIVDREVMTSQNMLGMPVDQQLKAVLELCGDSARIKYSSTEESVRENMKRLFTLSVGKEATGILLQFESVEGILTNILNCQ